MDGSSVTSADMGMQAPLYDQFWDHNLVTNTITNILSLSKHSFKNTGTGLGTLT